MERLEDQLADALEERLGHRPEGEFPFHPYRKWRLDLAYPDQKIGVEIDGQRHLSNQQQRNDAEKLNAAALMGWRIFRYPAQSLMIKSRLPMIVEQITRAVVCEPFIDDLFPLTGDI